MVKKNLKALCTGSAGGLVVGIGVMFLGLQGCSSVDSLNRDLDQKVAQESSIKTRQDLRAESKEALTSNPNLTADERSKLLALRGSTRHELDAIRAESLKLKSILIQDVVAQRYDSGEVGLIKKKLTDLSRRRLEVLFDAVEGANHILGRSTPRDSRISNEQLIEGELDWFNL